METGLQIVPVAFVKDIRNWGKNKAEIMSCDVIWAGCKPTQI